jgi:FixJ family two-component response regulator
MNAAGPANVYLGQCEGRHPQARSVALPGSDSIAVVDDDPGVRGSIVSLLRSTGRTGVPFAAAEDLLAYADWKSLRCIVTDLHMPGMSGADLQQVLNEERWPLPLIMMTAFPTAAVRENIMTKGACAFLTKPIDPDALLDAVEQAMLKNI